MSTRCIIKKSFEGGTPKAKKKYGGWNLTTGLRK